MRYLIQYLTRSDLLAFIRSSPQPLHILFLLPCFLYAVGVRDHNIKLIRFTAGWTVLGIVLNRLNISLITFNWQLPYRYVPSWMELWITLSIVTAGLVSFRLIVNRMAILAPHPDYPEDARHG